MRTSGWVAVLFLGFCAGAVTSPAQAWEEKKIELDALPGKVKAAAKRAFPEAKLVGAVKEVDDDDKDEILYILELSADGKTIEVAVDDDGDIEAVEKEIDAADLPKAVTRAAAQRFPNGKIAKVEEVSDADDAVVYELEIKDGGKRIEVVMSPNGKILDIEDDDDDNDKPKDEKKKDKKEKKDKKKDKDDDKGDASKGKD